MSSRGGVVEYGDGERYGDVIRRNRSDGEMKMIVVK